MFCKSPQWKISLQEPQDIVKSNNVQSVVSAAHEVNEI